MKSIYFVSFLAFILISACNPSSGDQEKVSSNEDELKGIISVEIAKRFVSNYKDRVYQPRVGFNDTRCVWFSLEQLDSFIQRIKNEKGDGVRFYLAAYDFESIADFDIKSDYRDHTTLVMVSTYDSLVKGTDTMHIDYYGNKVPGRRGAILTATPENQGELCPPPTVCDDIGAKLLK